MLCIPGTTLGTKFSTGKKKEWGDGGRGREEREKKMKVKREGGRGDKKKEEGGRRKKRPALTLPLWSLYSSEINTK